MITIASIILSLLKMVEIKPFQLLVLSDLLHIIYIVPIYYCVHFVYMGIYIEVNNY